MGTYNRQFTDGKMGDRKRQDSWRGRNYQYEPCNADYAVLGLAPYAFPTGVVPSQARVTFPGGDVLMNYLGAGQTILGPQVAAANGLLSVALDQTNNDGAEYLFDSEIGAFGRHTLTIGTSPAAFGKLTFKIDDVSGTDDCAFGLRKAEAFQANIDDYDELVCLNVISGVVTRETILNGGATSSVATGFTWADLATHELSYVANYRGDRQVDVFFDGSYAGKFTFDAGEVIQPFFYLLQAPDLTPVYWSKFEIGYVKDVERGI